MQPVIRSTRQVGGLTSALLLMTLHSHLVQGATNTTNAFDVFCAPAPGKGDRIKQMKLFHAITAAVISTLFVHAWPAQAG